MRRLHLARSWASSLDNSLSDKSFLMLSNHLRFGLPLLLFPGTSIAITLLPTYSSSLLNTCPYHFNLLYCTFLDISPTFVVPLILSFLILSSSVTPLIHLNILICATSNFFSCVSFTAHVSAPYIIAGAKTIKRNTNTTQNKSQTHCAKQHKVTSFLNTDCELSTETCSKNVYSIGPWSYNCLVYFPLTLKLILRSHRIPDTVSQFFHPDCILCVISCMM